MHVFALLYVLISTLCPAMSDELMTAVREGNIDVVRNLLKNPNLNRMFVLGDVDLPLSPLHVALQEGKEEIAEMLLKHGAAVDNGKRYNLRGRLMPALQAAVHHGMKSCFDLILARRRIDVNAADNKKDVALHVAVENKREDMVGILLKRGANVNAAGSGNNTPLHVAACKGTRKVVTALLNAGAVMDVRNVEGKTAVHMAARNHDAEVMKLLIRRGADIEGKTNAGRRPLHEAAQFHLPYTTLELLEAGALMESKDDRGNTALHLACQAASRNGVSALLSYGASAYEENNDERTPSLLALTTLNVTPTTCAVPVLIEAGIDFSGDIPRHILSGVWRIASDVIGNTTWDVHNIYDPDRFVDFDDFILQLTKAQFPVDPKDANNVPNLMKKYRKGYAYGLYILSKLLYAKPLSEQLISEMERDAFITIAVVGLEGMEGTYLKTMPLEVVAEIFRYPADYKARKLESVAWNLNMASRILNVPLTSFDVSSAYESINSKFKQIVDDPESLGSAANLQADEFVDVLDVLAFIRGVLYN